MKRHLVFFYWLLLLVSTLAIGGVTFYLLQRENDRLRNMASDTSVRTGQTIAYKLDSLVTHAKTASMDELAKLPEGALEAQLLGEADKLKDTYPFAHTLFYYVPERGLEFPKANSPEREILQPLLHNRYGWVWDQPIRPFQRFMGGVSFRGSLPPNNNAPMRGGPPPINASVPPGSGNNSSFSANGTSVNLGFDPNNLNGVPDGTTINLSANNGLGVPQIIIQFSNGQTINLSGDFAKNFANATFENMPPNAFTTELQDVLSKMGSSDPGQPQVISSQTTFTVVAGANPINEPNRPDQRWLPVGRNDDYHWLGWMRAVSNGPVRGVLLSWEALENAMGQAFPERLDAADGFILRDPAGKAVKARFADGAMLLGNYGNEPVNDPAVKPAFPYTKVLSVGPEMPGWKLEVYFNPEAKFTSHLMAISTVLVTVLVISVLVGGTLLMREARREAFDAARRTSFVSNVSHELKTPLTTIRMYAELLGDGRVRDQAKQQSYLTTIISESQRLTRLVNNVLDFSRLEQGRKKYNLDNVSLAEVVRSVLEAQQPRFDEAGFQVEANLDTAMDLFVHTDRDALEQVLLNLMDNALKYAADGHWLGVRISHNDKFATLTVSDHGPGVPSDQQEKIFQMFHRVDDSITARLPGAGLGLSIARRLLRDQEGDLHYEANSPRGASFVASLPLAVPGDKLPPPTA